jgi:uncharacterized phage-associated protein
VKNEKDWGNMKNELDVFSVANYFLSKSSMSPKKLQKLVYFSYAWYITLYTEKPDEIKRLFSERPEAWIHGPVFPSLYAKYREYLWQEIEKVSFDKNTLNESIITFLNEVWENYGSFSADELEYMTHQEAPWKVARNTLNPMDHCNTKIDDNVIFDYYLSRIKETV